jgi:hypothetical protein
MADLKTAAASAEYAPWAEPPNTEVEPVPALKCVRRCR